MSSDIRSGVLGYLKLAPPYIPHDLLILRGRLRESNLLFRKLQRVDMSEIDANEVLKELIETLIKQVGTCESELSRANDFNSKTVENYNNAIDYSNLTKNELQQVIDGLKERVNKQSELIQEFRAFKDRIQGQLLLLVGLLGLLPTLLDVLVK